jgi:hypothetical protein
MVTMADLFITAASLCRCSRAVAAALVINYIRTKLGPTFLKQSTSQAHVKRGIRRDGASRVRWWVSRLTDPVQRFKLSWIGGVDVH